MSSSLAEQKVQEEHDAFTRAVVSLTYVKRTRSLVHNLVESDLVRIFSVNLHGIVDASSTSSPAQGTDLASWPIWHHLSQHLHRAPSVFHHRCFQNQDNRARFTTVVPRYVNNKLTGWVVQTYLSPEPQE